MAVDAKSLHGRCGDIDVKPAPRSVGPIPSLVAQVDIIVSLDLMEVPQALIDRDFPFYLQGFGLEQERVRSW